MPKPKSEEDKKHGDKLESLINRTGGAAGDESDESDERDEGDADEDPAELQDDDDEDVLNDDSDSRRDAGKRR